MSIVGNLWVDRIVSFLLIKFLLLNANVLVSKTAASNNVTLSPTSNFPTSEPSFLPSLNNVSMNPSNSPTASSTANNATTQSPTELSTATPSFSPTPYSSLSPSYTSLSPSYNSLSPSYSSISPSLSPSIENSPTLTPSIIKSYTPTLKPSMFPSRMPMLTAIAGSSSGSSTEHIAILTVTIIVGTILVKLQIIVIFLKYNIFTLICVSCFHSYVVDCSVILLVEIC